MASSANILINNIKYVVPSDQYAGTTLNEYLRKHLLISGTKVLCREGGCGVCVVYVEYPHPAEKRTIVKRSINSCLCPVLSCDGWSITTVEGIVIKKKPHEIQKRLTEHYGTQCGYCTPGMVMNMYSLTKNYPDKALTQQIVEDSFDGNICRCTGYRPILDAFKSFASDSKDGRGNEIIDMEDMKPDVCPKTGLSCRGSCGTSGQERGITVPSHEPSLGELSWYQPATLQDLYTLMATTLVGKKVFFVAGHTSVGVFDDGPWECAVDTKKIADLYAVQKTPLTFGANITLNDLIVVFYAFSTESGWSYLSLLADHIKKIANVPVRNAGTWCGNMMMKNAHNEFPSDVFLCLEVASATLTIAAADGTQATVSPLQFMTMNMTSPLRVVLKANLQAYSSDYVFRTYKIMPRSQNAHALVNAGFRAKIDRSQAGKVIISEQPTIIFGNISKTFVHAKQTEAYLINKNIADPAVLQGALKILSEEVVADYVPSEASPAYKKRLSCALFYKFALELVGDAVDPRFRSAVGSLVRPISTGTQDYPTNKAEYPLTQPIPKIESMAQCTGAAQFISDMDSSTLLYAAFALCEQGNADIDDIDGTAAVQVPGVVQMITAMDIPGVNNFSPAPFAPEELLATKNALFAGQPVAIIVAESQLIAESAAKLVKVKYSNIKTPILTCQDAIQAQSFYPSIPDFTMGNAQSAIANAPHQVSGKLEIGSQIHFHMETQVAICRPREDGLDVETGTQWLDSVQDGIAQCLGVNKSSIDISVKRIGGAFGGKITRNNIVATACAVAASLTNKPVKMHMSLWDNAKVVGKRNPYYVVYQVGFGDDGKLEGIIMNAYTNCGAAANDSPISGLGVWGDNTYLCQNWKISMTNCRTNTPANTWTRAPGSTEAIFFMENIMEHIAQYLKKPSIDVKQLNFYQNGDTTITGQKLEYCSIKDLTAQLLNSSTYQQRVQDIAAFNKSNRWRKKGISVSPMKYGAIWNGNNFNCLIAIFHNGGAVAVSHGGSEIGQGINTKVAQVVAYTLGIPLESVSIKPNFTLVNPNATPTGGSITSEIVCLAALDACGQLMGRIQPVQASMPGASWSDVIEKCYQLGLDLSARSWVYPKTQQAPVYYNTYGVTCTEVEMDVLTGQSQVSRLDLLYDCGESISPLVDVGQVEGAIVMGLGYYTMEELKYDKDTGQLVTFSTWTYKPPTTKDIPIDFRIQLLQNAPNPVGVLRSKLVAEPPLCMTCSVVFALRNACSAALDEIDKGQDWFRVDAPMTVERSQEYCGIDISQFTYS